MLTLVRGRKVPVAIGQKIAPFSNSSTILQTRPSSIRIRTAKGPLVQPFPKISVPTRQGRRPRSSPPEGRASGVEELRFRRAKRTGTKGLHSLFSLYLKPPHSKGRHRSADMLFSPKSRGFADQKTERSAGLPSAVAADPVEVRPTSTFTCAMANRPVKSAPVSVESTGARVLGFARLAHRPRRWNGLRRFRKRLRLLSGAVECLRWLC